MGVKLRIQANKSGRNSFYLDINHGGRWPKEFISDLFIYAKPKTAEEKQFNKEAIAIAEKKRSDRELEIISGVHESIKKFNQDGDLLKYFEAYRKDYDSVDYRKVDGSITYLKQFRTVPFKAVNENFVADFKKFLEASLSQETARAYFAKFKQMLIRAHHDGLCKFDVRVYKPRFKSSGDLLAKEVLEPNEIQVIASTPCGNETIKWASIFACFTGLDYADVFLLKWPHVKGGLKKPRTKTDVKRRFPLHPTALAILSKMDRKTEYVFQDLPHRPEGIENMTRREVTRHRAYSLGAVNKTIQALVVRAGIDKHITFHCFRHSFGTNLEGDDRTVAQLLGHSAKSGSKMVAKYRRIKDERALAAINSLKGVEV